METKKSTETEVGVRKNGEKDGNLNETEAACSQSVQVAVRIRPLSKKETREGCQECLVACPRSKEIIAGDEKNFQFDAVFGDSSTQVEIFEWTTKPLILRCLDGYNATVFAYGQTGSGKTFTMGSTKNSDEEHDEGIIPRVVKEIYGARHHRDAGKEKEEDLADAKVASENSIIRCDLTFSFLEIYNEEVKDLLDPSSGPLSLRENIQGEVTVAGLSQKEVQSPEDVWALMDAGQRQRSTAATNMNDQSSRSHAICTLHLQVEKSQGKGKCVESNFHLVDLAGSERAKKTGAQGKRMQEGININKGLLALGNVISALAEAAKGQFRHVPYRDSKLTRLLQSSLGGNSHTVMIACVSPADSNMEESLNTLRYAQRARAIENTALKNEVATGTYSASEFLALQRQVRLLKLQLLQQAAAVAPTTPIVDAVGSLSSTSSSAENASSAGIGVGADELHVRLMTKELESENIELKKKLASAEILARERSEEVFQVNLNLDRLKLKCDQMRAQSGSIGEPGTKDPESILPTDEEEDAAIGVLEEQRRQIEEYRKMLEESQACSKSCEISFGEDSQEDEEQKKLADEIADLQRTMEWKEREAKVMMDLEARYADDLRRKDEEAEFFKKKKLELEAQLDRVEKNDTKNGEKERAQILKLRSQIKDYTERLKDYNRLKKEHRNVCQQKVRAEKEATSIKERMQDAIKMRGNMQRQMKEDAKKYMKEKRELQLKEVKLKRDYQRKEYELQKLQSAHKLQQQVMKRRAEEAAAQKRRRDENHRSKFNPHQKRPRNGKEDDKKSAMRARAEEVKSWIEQQITLEASLSTARKQLEGYLAERSAVAKELHCLREAIQNDDDSLYQTEIDRLSEQVEKRTSIIRDMQQSILDLEKCSTPGKERWSHLKSPPEMKMALSQLLKSAVNAVETLEETKRKMAAENEEVIERMAEAERNRSKEALLALEKTHQEKIAVLLVSLEARRLSSSPNSSKSKVDKEGETLAAEKTSEENLGLVDEKSVEDCARSLANEQIERLTAELEASNAKNKDLQQQLEDVNKEMERLNKVIEEQSELHKLFTEPEKLSFSLSRPPIKREDSTQMDADLSISSIEKSTGSSHSLASKEPSTKGFKKEPVEMEVDTEWMEEESFVVSKSGDSDSEYEPDAKKSKKPPMAKRSDSNNIMAADEEDGTAPRMAKRRRRTTSSRKSQLNPNTLDEIDALLDDNTDAERKSLKEPLQRCKVNQLKAVLRSHGLPVSGKKDVLIERLRNHTLAIQWLAGYKVDLPDNIIVYEDLAERKEEFLKLKEDGKLEEILPVQGPINKMDALPENDKENIDEIGDAVHVADFETGDELSSQHLSSPGVDESGNTDTCTVIPCSPEKDSIEDKMESPVESLASWASCYGRPWSTEVSIASESTCSDESLQSLVALTNAIKGRRSAIVGKENLINFRNDEGNEGEKRKLLGRNKKTGLFMIDNKEPGHISNNKSASKTVKTNNRAFGSPLPNTTNAL